LAAGNSIDLPPPSCERTDNKFEEAQDAAQPVAAARRQYITDINVPQVGQTRVDQMYPIGSMLKAGARIVGGSDWPVSSMNPLLAIETAVTRSDPTGRLTGVLNEDERVSLADVLAAYTINGAYLMHQETQTGSLEAGKAADFVVLARDLFEIPPQEIGEVEVTRTVLDGVTVYQR